jgi:hypothetical protein
VAIELGDGGCKSGTTARVCVTCSCLADITVVCVVDAKGCALAWDVGLDLELVRLLQESGTRKIQTDHCMHKY